MGFSRFLLAALLLALALSASAAPNVQVKGLFKGSAVLLIDGKQRLLKVGKTSPEGVQLIAADAHTAEVEFDGQRRVLRLSRQVGGGYQRATQAEVRIASGRGGHYLTPGRINGLAVDFMVDTGATSVAMNLPTAKRLGLNYRAGREIRVNTANGVAKAYLLMLRSVSVGNVTVENLAATVTLSDFPQKILLGNSYLSRVDLQREGGVLVLKSRL